MAGFFIFGKAHMGPQYGLWIVGRLSA